LACLRKTRRKTKNMKTKTCLTLAKELAVLLAVAKKRGITHYATTLKFKV